jgi:hypothetical protein
MPDLYRRDGTSARREDRFPLPWPSDGGPVRRPSRSRPLGRRSPNVIALTQGDPLSETTIGGAHVVKRTGTVLRNMSGGHGSTCIAPTRTRPEPGGPSFGCFRQVLSTRLAVARLIEPGLRHQATPGGPIAAGFSRHPAPSRDKQGGLRLKYDVNSV